jgi:putative oxidoreductase
LQRLFSTFANGWPGWGLLIQRLVTGTALLHGGMVVFGETTMAATIAPHAAGAALAIFIIMGLWTPVAGALIAPVELWTTLVTPGDWSNAILLATLGVTLAMIGPGAFSIDARLFGRKHIGG